MLELYQNIKARRIELGLSQSQLAEMTGYADKTAISHIENGKRDISHSKLIAFAVALKTTPGELLGTTEDNEYRLIEMFGDLNEEGQQKVLDYVTDLVSTGRYSLKCDQSQVV